MARPVRTPLDEVDGLDEEFLFHVDRGSELLAQGDAEGARAALARAAQMRPHDAKALGLLGQAWYRLGNFDEAAKVFGKLVEQNPLESGAQVNLGLANLRGKRYVEAIEHLERALDVNPDHRKAMGYLGLAWLEHGNVARAREWFSRAGSEHMVARCDELLAAARRSAPAPADPQWTVSPPTSRLRATDSAAARRREADPEPQLALDPEPPPAPPAPAPRAAPATPPAVAAASAPVTPPQDAPEEVEVASALRMLTPVPDPAPAAPAPTPAPSHRSGNGAVESSGWMLAPVSFESEPASCVRAGIPASTRATPPAEQARPAAPAPSATPAPAPAPPAAPVIPDRVASRPPTLDELTQARAETFSPDATFSIGGELLSVAVRGEVLARGSGLVATRGVLSTAPESRRYRGRGSDKLFGEGRDAVHRVTGEGALLFARAGRRFTVLDLAGGAAFFREEAVFALEGSVEFDNARLTARAGRDLDLVQLRGAGQFLLVARGELVSVAVSEAPLRVAAEALIGWAGALTPRLCVLAEGWAGDTRAVELSGEGRVLLDSGALDG